ncbi:MAG TPA: lantibiotic dehydratase, partial [Candidatus Dormibacteraeota bacterium]|nr:lantibiotic dehydratase [Candidatus Dormibacteraeota bacterium]
MVTIAEQEATAGSHLVALPGTGWHVWRDVVLRTTGFPAAGLDRLTLPAAAAAADAHLDGALDAEAYSAAFDQAALDTGRRLGEIAADPRFREAVAWQSPTAMLGVDGLLRSGPEPRPGENRRSRLKRGAREELVVKYWQRYCAKNETTGFFGPVGWARFDPEGPPVVARPGPGMVRDRRVFLEQWALVALAERLAEDPEIRPWLPAGLPPHLALVGRMVLRPAQPPAHLTRAEEAVLARCDGRRPVAHIAGEVVADPATGLRSPAEVYVLLERLVEQGLVVWGVDLPLRSTVEEQLRDTLGAIPTPEARGRALDSLRRLTAARDLTAATEGDPNALLAALAVLDGEFVSVTGRQPRRRAGEMYAGRTLCFLDATRDIDLVLGRRVLEELARPLAILLQAARWLTVAIADEYGRALRELYDDVAGELGTGEVPLGDLWFLAQGMLFGAGERPVDRVTAEFSRRWSTLFGLDAVAPGTRRLDLTSGELAAAAVDTFAAERPGWAGGRVHSPDIHLCASSVEAAAAGDFTLVLGEMHAAWATFDSWVFVTGHPAPDELRDAILRDLGPDRLLPLIPAH